MYCKTCGESNSEWSNYCSHDGTALMNAQTLQHLQLVNSDTNFCPNCGDETNGTDNYCADCGHSLLRFKQSTAAEVKTPVLSGSKPAQVGSFSFSSLFSKNVLKKTLIPAIAAFVLMLVLNYITYASIDNFYDELFKETIGYSPEELAKEIAEETGASIKAPGNVFGFTDNVMISHMVSPSYEVKVDSNLEYDEFIGTGELNLSFTYILFILFPILSLFVGGMIYRKQHEKILIREFLSGAIGIGLIYSVLFSVFSLFSGFNYDLQMADSGESIQLTIDTSYSIITTFFKGLLFGMIFSFLGMLFSINFRQTTKHLENLIPYGGAVHQGFSAFVRGFVTLSIILVIVLTSKLNELKGKLIFEWIDIPGLSQMLEKTTWFATYMGVQLSSIIYSMLHFSPLSFKMSAEGGSGGIMYSIFSGFSFSGEALNEDAASYDYFMSLYDIDLYLKLAILIPISLLIFAGFSLAKSNQASFQSLAVLSLVYSFFSTSLAAASGVHVDGMLSAVGEGTKSIDFSLAVSIFRVFIGSFILSYVASFAGSYLIRFFPGIRNRQ
ncbi:hypothetical protein JNUCC23_20965 [Peribacillus sp. JNUCC 23]